MGVVFGDFGFSRVLQPDCAAGEVDSAFSEVDSVLHGRDVGMDMPGEHVPETEDELNARLSMPSAQLVEMMRRLSGDILVLGIGGKMGVTLGMAAVRAAREAGSSSRVIGVSRFSDAEARATLEGHGIGTVACDLLDPKAVDRLPDAPNIIFMAGRKFGTEGQEALTWAMNTIVPANVCRRFAKSRIVAFSTGCVYPLVERDSGGCTETTAPAPVGEYAQSALGRERVFQYFSETHAVPVCLLRLNYAIDLRYGVLHDIASRVYARQPVSTTVPYFNCIWQGDANVRALLALEHCAAPARILNITGPEILSTRQVALRFGELLDRTVVFDSQTAAPAYLNDASAAATLFGRPSVSSEVMIRWTADWIRRGGRSLNKATHFEICDGRF